MKITEYTSAFMLIVASSLLSACDDGKIYPSDIGLDSDGGITVVMTGTVSGTSKGYDNGYTLAIAAFKDGDDFAVVSKSVTDGSEDVELNNISPEADTVELCVINSLRKRVATLCSADLKEMQENRNYFEIGVIDASVFSVINREIFSKTCVQCHGATGHSAAGLDLLYEEAYSSLVGKSSSVVVGELRVNPGNASASMLWQAVATDISESWSFHHTNLLTSDQCGFIENWINTSSND